VQRSGRERNRCLYWVLRRVFWARREVIRDSCSILPGGASVLVLACSVAGGEGLDGVVVGERRCIFWV
jgi:hypothetical protein